MEAGSNLGRPSFAAVAERANRESFLYPGIPLRKRSAGTSARGDNFIRSPKVARRSRRRKILSAHSDLHFASATLQRRLRASSALCRYPAQEEARANVNRGSNVLVSGCRPVDQVKFVFTLFTLEAEASRQLFLISRGPGVGRDRGKSRSMGFASARRGERRGMDGQRNGYEWGSREESSRKSVMLTSYEISVVRWDETRYGDGRGSSSLRLLVIDACKLTESPALPACSPVSEVF